MKPVLINKNFKIHISKSKIPNRQNTGTDTLDSETKYRHMLGSRGERSEDQTRNRKKVLEIADTNRDLHFRSMRFQFIPT